MHHMKDSKPIGSDQLVCLDSQVAGLRRWLEGFNRHDLDIIGEIFAPNYVFHESDDTRESTAAGTQDFWRNGLVTAPDCRCDDDYIMVAEGDLVTVCAMLRGTMKGPMKIGEKVWEPTNRAGSYKSFHWLSILQNS